MQEFDGPGLKDAQRILGLSSKPGQLTEFDSGVLQQVLDVSRIIRRGRCLAGSEGVWGFEIQNAHPGADSQSTTWDLYNAGSTFDGYPAAIPEGYDVWLLQPWSIELSIATLESAGLFLRMPLNLSQGSDVDIPLQLWSDQATITGVGIFATEHGTNKLVQNDQGAMRITRGSTLIFESVSTAALAQVDLRMRVGVFAAGLGQDALGAG